MSPMPTPLRPTKTEFDAHTADQSNPHAVTAAQVGADPAGSAAAVAADLESLRAPVVRRTPIGMVPYEPDSDDDVDRATALRAAIAAASSGDVIEAVGDFDLADTRLDLPAGVTLLGRPGRTRLYTSLGISNAEVVRLAGNDIVLDGVVIENDLADSNGTAVRAHSGTGIVVRHCTFRGDIDGLVVVAGVAFDFFDVAIHSRFDGIIGTFSGSTVFRSCRIIASGPAPNATAQWCRAVASGSTTPVFFDCEIEANDDNWTSGQLATLIYAVNGPAKLYNCRLRTRWSGFGSPTVHDLAGAGAVTRDANTTFDPAKVAGGITLARFDEEPLIELLKQIDGSGSGLDADLVRGTTPAATGLALLDDATAADARGTLELGTIATQAADNVAITGGAISGITDLAVADGGTGASTAAGARSNLGLADIHSNPNIDGAWIGYTEGDIGSENSVAFTANQAYFAPVRIWESAASIDISVRVLTGAGGSSIKCFVYRCNTDGSLGALVGTSGTGSGASAATVTMTMAEAVTPGRYYIALVSDGTPTIRCSSGTPLSASGGSATPRAARSATFAHTFADPAPATPSLTMSFASEAPIFGVVETP